MGEKEMNYSEKGAVMCRREWITGVAGGTGCVFFFPRRQSREENAFNGCQNQKGH